MTEHVQGTVTPFEAAVRIGRRLCDTAWWSEDGEQCNWLGRTDVEDPAQTPNAIATTAIGMHLYAGSTGVALFLAELFGQTGDAEFRRTATGALRRVSPARF